MSQLRFLYSLLPPAAAVLGFVVVWQLLLIALKVPAYIAPLPTSVIALLFSSEIPWATHAFTTLYESVLGFALAATVGVALAIAISFSRAFKAVAEPLVVAAQLMPKVAFVPILFLWFGLNDLPRVLTVFLICLFPVVIDTAAGLGLARKDVIDMVRTYNSSRVALLTKVLFPNALPEVFAGLKVSITLAMVGAVVAEFISASQGLGYLILSAQTRLDTTLAFSAASLLILMGFLLYGSVSLAERALVPWRTESR